MSQGNLFPSDANGVRLRVDGKGDGWAEAHRNLGPTFNMQDIDALFGIMAFGVNGMERVFAEYVPDDYRNRGRMIRKFSVVALFDRKSSTSAIDCSDVSCAFYLFLCRALATQQSKPPRFFYVVGGKGPPWLLREVNIETGEASDLEHVLSDTTQETQRAVWDAIGLTTLRQELARTVNRTTVST
jgi:hypothetical protein